MKKTKQKFLKYISLSLLIGGAIGAIITALNPGPQPFTGWAGSTFLASLCIFFLISTGTGITSPQKIKSFIPTAFATRLLLGIFLFIALPIWGYDQTTPNAGYIYTDAYQRDSDAWQLAQSDEPLWVAFKGKFHTDQYGGLLFLSSVVYRYLSPDAHRPLLILILSAFSTTIGIAFFWEAVKLRWDEKTADLASWILALYPESVILGSSQMREPFLIGLSGIAFWAVLRWKKNHNQALLALLGSLLGIILFSSRVFTAIFVLIAIWFWLENIYPNLNKHKKVFGWILLALAVACILFISINWLLDAARWDIYLTENSSGLIQYELEEIGGKLRIPFIVGYGLLQPLLPAAIAYPGIALMRAIAIYRAIGWYTLAPLIIFSLLAVYKNRSKKEQKILIWFLIFTALWIFLSSIRGGGDQWDNPRYRSILLPWMALLASWAWFYHKKTRSHWLYYILVIEAFFVLFFLQWYISRYYYLGTKLPFWQIVAIIASISAIILLWGLIKDLMHSKKR